MLSSYTTLSKRREQDLNLRRVLITRFLLAGGRFQPLSHLSIVGRAGFVACFPFAERPEGKGTCVQKRTVLQTVAFSQTRPPTHNHSLDEN